MRVEDTGHYLLRLYSTNGNRATNVLHDDKFNHLDPREYFANVNNTFGRLWILINTRTFPLFEAFFCQLSYGDHLTLLSHVAYVDVKYPECNSKSSISETSTDTTMITLLSTLSRIKLSSTLLSIKPTSTQIQSLLTSTLLDFQPCTCGTRNCKYNSYTTVVKINFFFFFFNTNYRRCNYKYKKSGQQ